MRFKKGYVPWNKGKKTGPHSEETKRKIGLKSKGRRHSEETKRKMSLSRKGRIPWNKGKTTGQVPWNKGKIGVYSEDTKRRISLSLKGSVPWMKGKHHTEETKEKMRIARLRHVIPIKNTKIEIAMHNEMNRLNISFQKHYHVKGQPDLVIFNNGVKMAVFCDGDYWHANPDKYDRSNLHEQQRDCVERDIIVNEYLKSHGWIVLRFWGSEINENVSACSGVIQSYINK